MTKRMLAGAVIIAAGTLAWAAISQSMTTANAESLSQLLGRTHVHGLAVDLAVAPAALPSIARTGRNMRRD